MFRTILTLLLAAAGINSLSAASFFSELSVDEVSSVIDAAASAKEAAMMSEQTTSPDTIDLTVQDMVMKVYGVLDNCNSMKECKNSAHLLNLTPEEEDNVLWLETAGGYNVDYYGRNPDVSALAHFGNGPEQPVSDYGYFFLFPYSDNSDPHQAESQIDFTTLLLQEMHDVGIPMAMCETDAPEALFAAVGDYDGKLVDVRLLNDQKSDGAGRYILILSIEPNAYSAADSELAMD